MTDKCQRIGGCLHDLGYDHCCCDTGDCDYQTKPQHHLPPALLAALHKSMLAEIENALTDHVLGSDCGGPREEKERKAAEAAWAAVEAANRKDTNEH